jgi:23S rRNA (cytosine1962-C5)-methyltransferase
MTYQLIDFGDGRRLERFGALVLDRPCPAAEGMPRLDPAAWREADARFERTSPTVGQWLACRELPLRWTMAHGPFQLELKRTEFGHLGVFPEQMANWDWIAERIGQAARPCRVLNLFAYTGGSTLAAAAAGAEATHVDAAKNVVAWARRNAEISGLAGASIRWIAEDAMKFALRELKRERAYDAVILDPPSYGHGVRGEVWQVAKHLPRLLEICAKLTAGRCRFVLLTCHTPDYDASTLAQLLTETMQLGGRGRLSAEPLTLPASTGRSLSCGVSVAWRAE